MEEDHLCDGCGRMVSAESKKSGECKKCGNAFTGNILICVKEECGFIAKFFWEVEGLIMATCPFCGFNGYKEIFYKVIEEKIEKF